ncbi:pyridoxal-phosphate dependent enzyme [Ideonella sp. 4Y16]|uniref:Pyridoxal-phosphate dependent enzyme n=1 Tax=Ideonella alba TaxID=2824118 RepID=A0A940YDD8_9BURK|nr:pyridoxal-phosphate dependent enzyme [Ideonella alba]MBQ0933553.1 pyridoxal-phosphate dependent enzyme [Ideonella alba]MBQ0946558.1 pyridoxal-phosphate dependent enzyme [Ideonella alba]
MLKLVEEDNVPAFHDLDNAGRMIDRALATLGRTTLVTQIKRLMWLEPLVGVPVYAKLEFQQISGSFKFRGAWNALTQRTRPDVVAASAGNHGLAIATAARMMNLPARIVLPVGASRLKRSKLVFEEAQLLEHGDSLEAAGAHARHLSIRHGWDYISPFADRRVIAGGATVLVEALSQLTEQPAAVYVPVGGGGLLSGCTWARRYLQGSFSIIGAEPENYASVQASLHSGKPVRVLNQPTFADGLAVQLSEEESTLSSLADAPEAMLVCSEEEIAAATVSLLQNESWLVEPSGAIAVAALVQHAHRASLRGPALLLLTGGNVQKATLNRLLAFPFTNRTPLSRFLGLIGESPDERKEPRRFQYRSDGYSPEMPKPSLVQENERPDPSVDAPTPVHLDVARRDWTVRHREASQSIDEYRRYCESLEIALSPRVLQMADHVLAIASPQHEEPPGNDFTAKSHLRAMNILCSAVTRMFDWRSPAYDQSLVPQFLELRSQENSDVNYDRYGSPAVTRIESQLREVFRVGREDVACTVTSSGMAAYGLIESYLLRRHWRHGAQVAKAPYVYFEASEQLESLPCVRVDRLGSYDADEVAAAVVAGGHDSLFIDPVANNVELRVCDVAKLARTLARSIDRPFFLVVDGTMASAQLPTHLFTDEILSNANLEILYYESASKYLQLGFEYTLAGVVVHRASLRPYMERLRRNIGAILYSPDAALFPNYDSRAYEDQLSRIGANCARLAHGLASMPLIDRLLRVHSPALPGHVDRSAACTLNFTGGCLCLQFREEGLNAPDQLNAFIALVLEEARVAAVPLVKGVSFGFATSRISAAAAIADSERPFLRVYTGLLPAAGVDRLAVAFVRALNRFTNTNSDPLE